MVHLDWAFVGTNISTSEIILRESCAGDPDAIKLVQREGLQEILVEREDGRRYSLVRWQLSQPSIPPTLAHITGCIST